MIKNRIFLLSLAFILAISLPYVSAFTYEIPYYITGSGSPMNIYGLSFKTDNQCTVTLMDYSSLTDSNYDIDLTFLSPDNITLATGSLENQANHSCKFIGMASETTDLNGFYEGRSDIIHTGTGGYVTLTNQYQCEESDFYFDIFVETEKHNDSFTNVPNRFGLTSGPTSYVSNATILNSANFTNYDHCFSGMFVNPFLSETGSASSSGSYDRTIASYYPFNTTTGTVYYRFDLGDTSRSSVFCSEICVGTNFLADATLWLFDVRAGTFVVLHHSQVDCENTNRIFGNWTGILNLDENIEYMFVFAARYNDDGAVFPCSRTWELYEPFLFNMSIFVYSPDRECGEWSECDGTTQTRTCIDLNGIAPDRIEYRTCAIGIIENATLGFENFVTTTDVLKCEPQWILGCFYNIASITIDRPTDWTIIDPAYGKANFLQMTQEYATEGTRSLKMWQIPPKQGEVITNTTCGNLTSSIIPQVFQGVSNNTFSVSHNVTFPAENMQVSFDVKKCRDQVLQHSAIVPLSWGNISLLTLCDEVCYSESCFISPNGAYVFNIVDTNTSQSVFGVPQFADAELQTLSPTYDISNLGIIAGRTYNIVFAISNENPNDATGNCVYIDNVRYEVTEESLLEFVPNCESRCLDTTRIEATRTEEGSCFIVTQEDSPLCVDDTTATAIENQEDFCRDETTLRTFNEKTGKYESVDCSETGNVCFNGRCQSEEEITDVSTIPAEDTQEFLGWFNWLFSPLFIFFIITFVFAGIVSKATTSGSKDGKGTFEIFGVVVIVMLIIGALPGIEIIPIWIAIAIIVFISLMIAQVMGIFAGRG